MSLMAVRSPWCVSVCVCCWCSSHQPIGLPLPLPYICTTVLRLRGCRSDIRGQLLILYIVGIIVGIIVDEKNEKSQTDHRFLLKNELCPMRDLMLIVFYDGKMTSTMYYTFFAVRQIMKSKLYTAPRRGEIKEEINEHY